MPVPRLSVCATAAEKVDVDVLVLGVTASDDGGVRLLAPESEFRQLRQWLTQLGMTGGVDEFVRAPSCCAARSIALVGVSTPCTPDALRYAAGTAMRHLPRIRSVALALPVVSDADAQAVFEGAVLGAYRFAGYRSHNSEQQLDELSVVSSSALSDEALGRAAAIAQAVCTVRDLVNTPPSVLSPAHFADRAIELARDLPVDLEVLAEEQLEAGGFGGLIGVGSGSIRGPRLIKVSYNPVDAERHLALVGKGITFDSGGLSLKQSMVGMKYDMTGAATVLAVALAAARLKLPLRVTAWLCAAENMPSGSAIRPDDVLHIRGGTSVEVLNTDAEGRLVLADGLAVASEEQPDAIVDVATLTGAQRVALGTRYAGLMGDDALVARVAECAREVGETFWPMPLPDELRAQLASDIADLANVSTGNGGAGMLVAGVFLREFVGSRHGTNERIPWAHLDIAGPAMNKASGYGYVPKGPTGVAVRALIALAGDMAAK